MQTKIWQHPMLLQAIACKQKFGNIQCCCKMGAGYNNLRQKKKKQQWKVGREEEGSSSNRPELAAFFLALRDT